MFVVALIAYYCMEAESGHYNYYLFKFLILVPVWYTILRIFSFTFQFTY